MFSKNTPSFIGRAVCLPMMRGVGGYVEGVHNPVLDCEYSGQRATKRITKFDIAIGSLTGDVRYDNATAMEFFEDLLIDARGVALMLLTRSRREPGAIGARR